MCMQTFGPPKTMHHKLVYANKCTFTKHTCVTCMYACIPKMSAKKGFYLYIYIHALSLNYI